MDLFVLWLGGQRPNERGRSLHKVVAPCWYRTVVMICGEENANHPWKGGKFNAKYIVAIPVVFFCELQSMYQGSPLHKQLFLFLKWPEFREHLGKKKAFTGSLVSVLSV